MGYPVICIVGAHPDDCEVHAGGSAARWSENGADVHFISITNGQAGHHEQGKDDLVKRREKEALQAASVINASYYNLGAPDGYLEANLEYRMKLIRLLRSIRPDVVITNRPQDYHPDHRYTSRLVLDTAFLLMVPNIVEDAPILESNPVFLFWYDRFISPSPFVPDFFVDITGSMSRKMAMLHCHESQFFEWLPWLQNILPQVPKNSHERETWLYQFYSTYYSQIDVSSWKKELTQQFGDIHVSHIKHVEAFAWCQYGGTLTEGLRSHLAI